ncbi:hypothetical protein AVEN_69674-1 [Araneus ventricosus]|uniref:RNase H type-1 domain-containing protein n=1 Tax=Araneus ventricosus TaxID=182803 RepID=A0A4Y2JPN5_ARAVE|nr:hypothetical protein AVEN_69674-1 [Araneus ventricosus]
MDWSAPLVNERPLVSEEQYLAAFHNRPKVKSNFVLSIKDNLYNAKDLVSLVWVKAHAGNLGNELADHFAKVALSCEADMSIPAPYSYVKRACNELLMSWDSNLRPRCEASRRTKDLPTLEPRVEATNETQNPPCRGGGVKSERNSVTLNFVSKQTLERP